MERMEYLILIFCCCCLFIYFFICCFFPQFVKQFGLEADRHFLRCLFSSIDFGDALQVSKNSLHAKLLSTELTSLLNKSSLISNLCFAVDNCFTSQKVSFFFFLLF